MRRSGWIAHGSSALNEWALWMGHAWPGSSIDGTMECSSVSSCHNFLPLFSHIMLPLLCFLMSYSPPLFFDVIHLFCICFLVPYPLPLCFLKIELTSPREAMFRNAYLGDQSIIIYPLPTILTSIHFPLFSHRFHFPLSSHTISHAKALKVLRRRL